MPNMVYGRITRERAKEAYAMGLRASQIVGFLVDHAHPLLLSRPKVDNSNSIISNANTTNNIMRMTGTISNSIVPQNITDLLLLWEAENYRIHSEDCLLFTLGEVRGMSLQNYQSIIEYMQRVDCLLWEHTPSRIMAVTLSGAKLLQSYAEETLGLFSY
jgi:transcription initiation factor TFIIH subunit 4